MKIPIFFSKLFLELKEKIIKEYLDLLLRQRFCWHSFLLIKKYILLVIFKNPWPLKV